MVVSDGLDFSCHFVIGNKAYGCRFHAHHFESNHSCGTVSIG